MKNWKKETKERLQGIITLIDEDILDVYHDYGKEQVAVVHDQLDDLLAELYDEMVRKE